MVAKEDPGNFQVPGWDNVTAEGQNVSAQHHSSAQEMVENGTEEMELVGHEGHEQFKDGKKRKIDTELKNTENGKPKKKKKKKEKKQD